MGLLLGFGPTNYGYLTQGFFKYGLYEYFKTTFAKMVGQQKADSNATLLYLVAGMTAELIADVALTPFEAIRIRMVADPEYARGTASGIYKIYATEGMSTLYKGFIPLVLKQVPYTAVKFAVFEGMLELIYDKILKKPRHELSKTTQLAVSFVSGFVGGVVSAVASHPADTMLTRVNVAKGSVFVALMDAIRALGFRGIWAGVVPRMGMVGTLAALQLFVYDAAKVYLFGLPTSQGIKSAKKIEIKKD